MEYTLGTCPLRLSVRSGYVNIGRLLLPHCETARAHLLGSWLCSPLRLHSYSVHCFSLLPRVETPPRPAPVRMKLSRPAKGYNYVIERRQVHASGLRNV